MRITYSGGNKWGRGYSSPSYTKSNPSYKKGGSFYDWSKYYSYMSWGDETDTNDDLIVKDPITYQTPTKKDIKDRLKYIRQDETFNLIKELSRVCYLKMFGDKDFLHENFQDESSVEEDKRGEWKKKKELFENIYDTFIPGYTPLEQAIAIYLKLDSGNESEDGISLENCDNEDLSLEFNRELYTDPTINEQLEFNELSKKYKIEII
jgi:hypothetical protein